MMRYMNGKRRKIFQQSPELLDTGLLSTPKVGSPSSTWVWPEEDEKPKKKIMSAQKALKTQISSFESVLYTVLEMKDPRMWDWIDQTNNDVYEAI